MVEYSLPNRLLHWFATLVALWVLLLICSGGLVTSHEAGMAVPDWPNTFGYNMFLFPISRWVGQVFFEHTHRLIAFTAGLLTLVLFVFSLIVEKRKWVKLLAAIALVAVILQAILGGLRVVEHNAALGFFHGMLAQSYFALTASIALVTSKYWLDLPNAASPARVRRLRNWTYAVTGMVFVQLMLGAAMRHSHAGLSIHDFPTTYGGLLPPLDPGSLTKINEARESLEPPTSAGLILLQYVHRVWALLIGGGLMVAAIAIVRCKELDSRIRWGANLWAGLVVVQIALGAWTVLSNKAADVATAHVFVGALMLMIGVCLSILLGATFARSQSTDKPGRMGNVEALTA